MRARWQFWWRGLDDDTRVLMWLLAFLGCELALWALLDHMAYGG